MTKTNNKGAKPVDNVFIVLAKALNDEIVLKRGKKLFIAAEINPEFHVTVTGKVDSLPSLPKTDTTNVCSKIKEGDEVAFSFQVVADRTNTPPKDYFQPLVDEPYEKQFINNKGEKLMKKCLPFRGNNIWIAILLAKDGDRIDGVQGTESEADRFLSQFNFANDIKFYYNNLIWMGGKSFWACDYEYLFAKKRGNKIIALGDRVIMEEVSVDITQRVALAKGIQIPGGSLVMNYNDRGRVVSGGKDVGLKPGDVAFFEPQYVEKYNFWGKDYLLIREKRVNAIL